MAALGGHGAALVIDMAWRTGGGGVAARGYITYTDTKNTAK